MGPGLLYAGAAIGVSHLVQSTRAGANFGAIMVLVVLLANALKYPFFEFGPRYAAATGKSILHGYRKIGKWAPALFLILTISTMFTVQAAITIVTAGLAEEISGIDAAPWKWSLFILVICSGVLYIGGYSVLDKLMKYVIVGLALTTVLALISAQTGNFVKLETAKLEFDFANEIHVYFLIALIGWMPAPVDIAVWQSVWTVAKNRTIKRQLTTKEVSFDFKLGFWGTAILAACFVLLGSTVLYGSGVELESSGSGFAAQLIGIYTSSIGSWAYPFIALAAFTTMFSTSLTCLDAFPRVISPSIKILFPSGFSEGRQHMIYNVSLFVLLLGTVIIITFFAENMKGLVDLATTISFMTAPFIAWLNYKAVTLKDFPDSHKPGKGMKLLSAAGLFFLLGLGFYFVFLRFF